MKKTIRSCMSILLALMLVLTSVLSVSAESVKDIFGTDDGQDVIVLDEAQGDEPLELSDSGAKADKGARGAYTVIDDNHGLTVGVVDYRSYQDSPYKSDDVASINSNMKIALGSNGYPERKTGTAKATMLQKLWDTTSNNNLLYQTYKASNIGSFLLYDDATNTYHIDSWNSNSRHNATAQKLTFNKTTKKFSYENYSCSADPDSGSTFYGSQTGEMYDFIAGSGTTYESGSQMGVNSGGDGFGWYYALNFKTEFIMPENGTLVYSQHTEPMKFEFAGDDLILVYIDGVRVLNGSIQWWPLCYRTTKVEKPSIDFSTGIVYTMTKSNTVSQTTLYDQFSAYCDEQGMTAAQKQTYLDSKFDLVNGNHILKTGVHNFAFFYAETGGIMSNCRMSFNLLSDKSTVANFVDDESIYEDWLDELQLKADANGGSIPTTTGWNGSGSSAVKTILTGSAYGTLPEPTMPGYTFSGWYTDPTNGTQVTSATTMGSSNTTIYAHYTPITYTIAYVLNGGTNNANNPTSAAYDAEVRIVSPTRSGYTFTGWTISGMENGVTHYYKATAGAPNYNEFSGTTLSSPTYFEYYKNLRASSGTVTFTATWQAGEYCVTYKPNYSGSTANNVSQSVTSGSTWTTKPNTTFTRTGYTLSRWDTAAEGNGTSYACNASQGAWSRSSNLTLYAVWTPTSYNISYQGMTGASFSGNNHPTSANFGQVFSVSAPTKTGYTFTGWMSDDIDPSTAVWGTTSTPNISMAMATLKMTNGANDVYFQNLRSTAGTAILTATWKATTYSVVYWPNYSGSTSGSTSQSVSTGSTWTTKPNTTFTRTGYTISRWDTASAGNGTSYACNASQSAWSSTSRLDLYAVWSPVSYYVDYAGMDGATHGTNHPSTATFDTAFAVSAPTKSGYTFLGWTVTSNLNTSTAKWGSTSGSVSNTIGSPSSVCVSGTSDIYFKNLTATAGTHVTLTANWRSNTFNVTYYSNGGTFANSATSKADPTAYYPGDSVPVYGAAGSEYRPTKTGYTLSRWDSSSAGTGTSYTIGDTFTMPSSNVSLYAVWTLANYHIYYGLNGGSFTSSSTTTEHPTTVAYNTVFHVNNPTRSYYTFSGWDIYTMDTTTHNYGTTNSVTSNTTATSLTVNASQAYFKNLRADDEQEVYFSAKWTPNNYTLTVVPNGGTWKTYTTPQTYTLAYKSTTDIDYPTRTGYTFTGWTLSPDYTGSTMGSRKFTMGYENTTITANWDAG